MCRVIIETPKGSRNKYHFDNKQKFFLLKKTIPLGTSFPFDFGFIPGTVAEDGDPIDVMVLMDEPGFPGCVADCRIIGVLEVEQKEKGVKKIRNDRIVAVEINSRMYGNIHSLEDLDRKLLQEVIEFFTYYNKMEGKKFSVIGKADTAKAMKMIERSKTTKS